MDNQESKQSRWFDWRVLLPILGLLLLSCSEPTEEIAVTAIITVDGEFELITEIIEATPSALPQPPAPRPPVRLDLSLARQVPNIDPQQVSTEGGIDLVENLFVGLTNFNHRTSIVEPELAERWETTENGRVWTFYLRDDLFWLRAAEQRQGESGAWALERFRPVNASDVVAAIQRVCDPNVPTPDAFILYIIEGCERVNRSLEPTETDIEAIGVRAIDETTVQFRLIKPISYFATITSLWLTYPVPRDRVEEFGDEWVNVNGQASDGWQVAANLTVNGAFFPTEIEEFGENLLLIRNPDWPFVRGGNIEEVSIVLLPGEDERFQFWMAKQLDLAPLPPDEQQSFIDDTPARARLVSDQTVFYYGFNFDSGVFREIELRRAFNAAVDREALIEELYDGEAVPMRHFTPPGVLGAPPVERIGIGYSPDYGLQQIAISGFRSCRLIPPVRMLIGPSDQSLQQAEIVRKMWIDELGCEETLIAIEQVQFGQLLADTERDTNGRPDMWELGWASYYPDAQHWFGDLLHCVDSQNRQNRPCSTPDDLIREAGITINDELRGEIYAEVEQLFFGDQGLIPLIPLYVRAEYVAVQNWLTYSPATFGGEQYDTYQIDQEIKRLEQSR